MAFKAPQHLQKKKSPFYWDWWGENPIEIVLVILIVVFFFALPRTGCGITQQNVSLPVAAASR
ncbi:MAG: hypothetical protein H0U74_08985 [Bradymonadaceae bacterium]|nr:hypothetical protein [Lujinxingiaceae bacterium]